VPVCSDILGHDARAVEPAIKQLFVTVADGSGTDRFGAPPLLGA